MNWILFVARDMLEFEELNILARDKWTELNITCCEYYQYCWAQYYLRTRTCCRTCRTEYFGQVQLNCILFVRNIIITDELNIIYGQRHVGKIDELKILTWTNELNWISLVVNIITDELVIEFFKVYLRKDFPYKFMLIQSHKTLERAFLIDIVDENDQKIEINAC